MQNAEESFKAAMADYGLSPPSRIVPDGKLHRFRTSKKHSDAAGWYVFHGAPTPVGIFGDWRTGLNQKWRGDMGRQLSNAERKSIYLKTREAMLTAQKERKQEQETKTRQAQAVWQIVMGATPCTHT